MMSESQKLALRGSALLKAHGLSQSVIEEVFECLVRSGYELCQERMRQELAKRDALISKAHEGVN
jgi:hypothetical protein